MTELYEHLSDEEFVDSLMRRVGFGQSAFSYRDGLETKGTALAPSNSIEQHTSMADGALPAIEPQRSPNPYRPLDSVWFGEEDAELIEQLLAFYPHREPRLILDATVNGGRFWRHSKRNVIGLDIDVRHRPLICADNRAMPFRSSSFDVVVYDPPHIPNQGRDRSKDFNTRFGLGARSPKENGYSFAYTYPAFMAEAWRVLVEDGVLLCKIADYVHNHRYQWAHLELVHAGQAAGFTACDCIIKVRKGPIVDPKWKIAHHSRRQHCYWIVFRKSQRCE